MISKKRFLEDYSIIKSSAYKYFEKGNINNSLQCIKVCAWMAYHLNLFYCDEELEGLIRSISGKTLGSLTPVPVKNRFVLCDFLGYDNRGLTQQYLRALISWKVEFLYILEDDNNPHDDIIQEIQNYKYGKFFISRASSGIEKIKEIKDRILEFTPQKILLHIDPWNTISLAACSAFPNIVKYNINLTDHAFWLGKNLIDYNIEFRNYGFNISKDYRNIHPEKLLIQPYYPITDSKTFLGFPEEIQGKIKILTGGSFYKMHGDNLKFFKLLKRILDNNKNSILLVVGDGDRRPLLEFIKSNKLEKRIYLLGNRKDINEVFKNSDIYISTYPISGGLMAQLAASNLINIVSYIDKDIKCNIIENELLFPKEKIQISFSDDELFLKEVDKLINEPDYRKERSKKLDNSIISVQEFNNSLNQVITSKTNNIDPKVYYINIEKFSDLCFDIENSFYKEYNKILFPYFKLTFDFNFFRFTLKEIIGILKRRFLKKIRVYL